MFTMPVVLVQCLLAVLLQALECCLLDINDGSVPREARWEFSDLTGQNCLECTILKKVNSEYKLIIYDQINLTHPVSS